MDAFASARRDMVETQLRHRGIRDKRVLAAMEKVPRHLFVAEIRRHRAYWDGPLAIGSYQTISQPYVVALTCELLEIMPNSSVLEIGAGSGYAAAILSELANCVVSVERLPELAELARKNLRASGYDSVEVLCSDGTLGCPEKAPFDAIAVAAGAPAVPEPLKRQLKIGGRLVIPVGPSRHQQDLVRVRRISEDNFRTDTLGAVSYVPLVGSEGWGEVS
eukprot:g1607.t1